MQVRIAAERGSGIVLGKDQRAAGSRRGFDVELSGALTGRNRARRDLRDGRAIGLRIELKVQAACESHSDIGRSRHRRSTRIGPNHHGWVARTDNECL